MKARYFPSWEKIGVLLLIVIMFIFSISDLTAVNPLFDQSRKWHKKHVIKWLLPFSTVAEYDSSTSFFYGRQRQNGSDYFTSVDSRTGKTTMLRKLPSYDNWIRGASALDSENHKFFFVALLNRKYHINTVDTGTGQIVESSVLSHPLKAIEYDPSSELLWGLSYCSGVERFVSVNPTTGIVITKIEMPEIKRIHSGILLNLNQQKFFFIGTWENRDHVCVVGPTTDSLVKLKGVSVGLDEYKIQSFSEDPSTETLFTSGVQRCTAIAGYDPVASVGFIAHFRPDFKDKEGTLLRINLEINEKYKSQGMKSMKLFVIGGVADDSESVRNLSDVYTILIEKIRIDSGDISKFHTGISYNVVIHDGEIIVF